jgi:hypothetical protein
MEVMKSTMNSRSPGTITLALVASVLLAHGQLLAQGAAGTGLAFLKLGVGARAVGLGEAYVSVADEASAAYWNPAGLAMLPASQLLFAHTEWFQGVTHDYIGYAGRGFGGGWGINVISAGVGGIESRTKPSAEPVGVFEAHNLALGISYGRRMNSNLSLGVSAKWLYEKVFTYQAGGYGLDFGAQLRLSDAGFRFGAVLQNLGGMHTLRSEETRLPTTLRVGASLPLHLGESRALIATDLVKVVDAESHLNVGGEWVFAGRYALRMGYQSGYDSRGLEGGAGFIVGRFQLDYGFVPMTQDLGNGHRFSVQLQL